MTSFDTKIAAAKGRPLGFDYLRLVLAVAVILVHAELIHRVWGTFPVTPRLRVSIGVILPMFFALSGFLVAGSLERSKSLVGFLGLRALRIVPALAVEVTLSALILGPIFTTYTMQEYFTDPKFRLYFLNIIGNIHYYLPGVFTDHPWQFMNRQLWTVPIELDCYLVLAVLALVRITRHKYLLLATLVVVQVGMALSPILSPPGPIDNIYHSRSLVTCFLFGLLLYKFRDKVPWSWPLFIASTVAMFLMLTQSWGELVFGLPAAYMAAFIGVTNPPRNKVLLSGDYSYGLFLYGLPIQQAVYAFGPWTHSWLANFVLSVLIGTIFAVFSWRVVENPALGLRRRFSRRPPPAADPGEAGGGISAVTETPSTRVTAPA